MIRMEVHHGKLYLIYSSGYIAFTFEEWQAAKETGDALFGNPGMIKGHVEKDKQ